jgi:transcriptional regulator with XRE-family HTH domain
MSKPTRDENRNFEMKINPETIRKWREQRAWSQEHLAEITGLSLRTIQRVEAEGKASNETRMALASAFGCGLADLEVVTEAALAATINMPASPTLNTDSRRIRPALIVLPVVAGFLLFQDWRINHGITWSRWSLLGLSLGLLGIGIKRMLIRHFPGQSRRKGFFIHAMIYALTCSFLGFMDWKASGGISWSQWPMIGWGLGLGLHGLFQIEPLFRKSPASL